MSYCSQCGSPIPNGQRICSMCMGDIDHGNDGYYRDYVERQDRDDQAKQQQEEEYENHP